MSTNFTQEHTFNLNAQCASTHYVLVYFTMPLNNQTTNDRQMTTNTKLTRHSRSCRHISIPTRYRAPTPTYSPHHCDSESFLPLSDSPLTSSCHSDRHPEPKCVVCRLLNRRKAGLSCTKCHNYSHLSCIKPRIPYKYYTDASVLALL